MIIKDQLTLSDIGRLVIWKSPHLKDAPIELGRLKSYKQDGPYVHIVFFATGIQYVEEKMVNFKLYTGTAVYAEHATFAAEYFDEPELTPV